MELANIEKWLEAYFEGKTTLEQEAKLRSYFEKKEVAPHLQVYKNMFVGFQEASNEVSQVDIKLPRETHSLNKSWLRIAASIAIVLGVAGFVFSNSGLTQEEQEALQALNKTKETMLLLSSNLNKGTKGMLAINQFSEAKNKILK